MQADEVSGSLRETGNYRRIVQRVSDAERLCKDMMALLKERAAVEKAYAKELHAWAKRGRELLQGGPEYETTEALFDGILTEGEKVGDLHLQIKDKLTNDVIRKLKIWTNESYQKSMSQIKEEKEMEKAFKNAQKPLDKLCRKVEKAKIQYHAAFKRELSAFNDLRNSYGNPKMSLRQVNKLKDRSVECRRNLRKANEKYVAALSKVHLYKPKYIADLTAVFDKAQEMERERLQFFKKIMFSVQKCFDVSQNSTLQQIYEEFYAAVDNADPEKEMKWWLQNHGPHMYMKWPTFEEYEEDWGKIIKCKSNKKMAPGLTVTNWRAVDEYLSESNLKSEMFSRDEVDSSDEKSYEAKKKIETTTSAVETGTRRSTNPFDEDESENEAGETYIDC